MKWLAILLVIVLAATGGFFVLNSGDDESSSNSSESSSTESNDETTELSSIKKLLERGGNVECTYDYTDDSGNRNEGVAYFSNNRMFGDFTATQASGEVLQSNVITVENTQYVWDNEKKEGYKIDLSAISVEGQESDDNSAVDQDQDYDFKCKSWNVDESKFEVPSDVIFIDNTAALEAVQQNTEVLQNACESITDPAQKSACEQAVGAQ